MSDMQAGESTRSDRVKKMAELARQRADDESAQAQQLINEFVRQAEASGVPSVELMATAGGRAFRTGRRGWYLRRDRTIAIGTDGGYYRLGLAATPRPTAWLRGVSVEPSPPPLVVGRGGKDGESGDLKDFLARALNVG